MKRFRCLVVLLFMFFSTLTVSAAVEETNTPVEGTNPIVLQQENGTAQEGTGDDTTGEEKQGGNQGTEEANEEQGGTQEGTKGEPQTEPQDKPQDKSQDKPSDAAAPTQDVVKDTEVKKDEIKPEPPKNELKLTKKQYKLGDKGEEVKQIQRVLNTFGHELTIDGTFGKVTERAVIDFQKRAKLKADGIVEAKTIAKLSLPPTKELMYNDDVCASTNESFGMMAEKFINSQKVSSKTQYYIYVDTENFRVNVLKGKTGNWEIVKSMKCSLGAVSTPTVKGKFTLGNKGPMFRVNSKVICKYYSQFRGNYLFHTVLLDNKGNVVDGRLGERISHGCIRLAIEDAKYINQSIPSGTAVWVK